MAEEWFWCLEHKGRGARRGGLPAGSPARPVSVPRGRGELEGTVRPAQQGVGRRGQGVGGRLSAELALADHAVRSQLVELGVGAVQLGVQHLGVCSPTHGTRVSGPSATRRHLDRVARARAPAARAVGRSISTSMLRAREVRIGDDFGGLVHRADGKARGRRARSRPRASSCRRPRLDRRATGRLEVDVPAGPFREARIGLPLGVPEQIGEREELVLAHHLHDEPTVLRLERRDQVRHRRRLAVPRRASRSSATMSVIATVASYIAMSMR